MLFPDPLKYNITVIAVLSVSWKESKNNYNKLRFVKEDELYRVIFCNRNLRPTILIYLVCSSLLKF